MPTLDLLAEQRIREWLQRPPAERERAAWPLDPAAPLEVQLASDVAELDRRAMHAAAGDERRALHRRADELMLRLQVILENQGRPLAAAHFAGQRRHRAADDDR